MTANTEAWLCLSHRTNHCVVAWEKDQPCQTLCNLYLVNISYQFWSEADPLQPLCVPCHAAAQRLFRRTHSKEHFVPAFVKTAAKQK